MMSRSQANKLVAGYQRALFAWIVENDIQDEISLRTYSTLGGDQSDWTKAEKLADEVQKRRDKLVDRLCK
jgi:hypothetical protein